MELRFWGVRGSIATLGPDTVAVGGNTTCVSLFHDDYVLIFDAGTGICRLGEFLEAEERNTWRGSIFLTHYHWDHIQGLPFFAPAYRQENRLHLYGEVKEGIDPKRVLNDQMQAPFFPVPLEVQEGLITFNPVSPSQEIRVSHDVTVSTVRLKDIPTVLLVTKSTPPMRPSASLPITNMRPTV